MALERSSAAPPSAVEEAIDALEAVKDKDEFSKATPLRKVAQNLQTFVARNPGALPADAVTVIDTVVNRYKKGITLNKGVTDPEFERLLSALKGVQKKSDGGRRRGRKTRKGGKKTRKGGRKTRKLRGRGLLDMFSRSKKLDSGLAGGVVPAGEIVSAIEGARGGDINVSSVFAYDRGLKLLEAITATNTSKYKKGYTLVQELARNSGKVTLADEIGEAMHTEGVFDPDDVQQAASELRTALSNYKPETGEVV